MSELEGVLYENLWANIFHDTILGSRWLNDQPFSPGRAAIGYPALYAMYRILDEFQPKSILEMGLGQSTRMIGRYMQWKEKNEGAQCHHYVVEHDPDWIEFFKKSNDCLGNNSEIVRLDMITTEFDDGQSEEKTTLNLYKNFAETFADKKFDFIFIDGPFGSPLYSRVNILDILPECLADSFVLMLDDAERIGETNTWHMIENTLLENQIAYASNKDFYSGLKSTAIMTSQNLHFLCTM